VLKKVKIVGIVRRQLSQAVTAAAAVACGDVLKKVNNENSKKKY
jgi:hypothetical protein